MQRIGSAALKFMILFKAKESYVLCWIWFTISLSLLGICRMRCLTEAEVRML